MRPNWSHQTSQMAMLVLMMILVVSVQFIVPTTIDPKLTALDCDFERGDLCNWKAPASSSSFKVGMPKENQNSLYYPFEDHTEHSSDGHFAYINGSNSFNQASGIMQTINPYPKQKVCFSFVYYFYANGNNALASLTLNMNGQTGSVPVFRAYEANELKWREVTITIDPNNTFYDTFMFKARVKIGVIAIDDIVVRPGECRERRGRKVCDYESSGDTCLFAPSDAQSKWTVMQGYAVDFGIRDHTDHTIYGHFYGVRFNQLDKSSTKQFSIQTKTIHENVYKCFRFAYFMQNVTPNTTLYYEIISDYIGRTLKPFEVSGSTMGMWLTHHYSLASLQENTFMMYHLKMTIDTGGVDPGYGRVFIDDVVFDTEPCEYGTVCDFENGDTCDLEAVSYYRTQSASYNAFLTRTKNYTKITSKYLSDYVDLMWHVFTPRQSSHFVQNDHSLGTSIGKYLLLTGADSYKRGIITTTRYQLSIAINGTFCFSFALYKPDSGTILEVYQGESSDSANGLKLWDIQRATIGWEVIDIETTLQDSSSKDIFFFLVGTIVNSGGAYLAIDDVQMASSRVCRPLNVLRSNPSTAPTSVITTTANPLTTFTCKSGKQISIDKTCDWVNDCEQGEDEMNCGSCDFVNHNLCRYKINAISNRYKYIFSDQGTDGPQSGSHSNSLYLITNGTFGSTFLDSPTIHQSYSQCELSFSYNYNTSDPTNVSLYLYLTFVDINTRFLIWQSNTSPILQHFWQKVILRLGRLTHPFRMSFVADTRYSTTKPVQSIGYQAIDLISMQNCAPPKALSNVECRNAFRCTNQVCIDSAFVCDLQDDCGDGSDEVACDKTLMTSFEFGLNRWGEGEISGWKVVKALFSSDLRRRPTFDHTTGYSHGSYLLAEVNEQIAQGTQKSIVAQIDSPPFSILANSGCDIRFYMFKYLRNSSLLVKLKNLNTSKERILLKLSFPRNRFVRYHHTVFPESVPSSVYKVVVTAILNVTYDDTIKRNRPYIALDDITFSRECILMPAGNNISVSTAKPDCPTLSCLSSNGTQICLSVNQFCDFVHDCKDGSDEVNCGDCDFNDVQMCGWKDIPVDTRHGWTVIKPASSAPRQLPALDANGNSTGGYAAIYTSYNGVLNYNVYLRSPLINADTSRKCKLRLSYFARSKATFLVGLAKERNVFFSSSQPSPQWQSFVVDIGRQKAGFGIDLVASTTFATPSLFGSVWYKDVAVDNLKLVDCDPNQSDKPNANETIICDFEQDLCGWNIIGATQRSKWQRTSDAHREPGNDHTSLKDPTPVRSGTWLTSQTLVNSASETDYLATAIPIQAGQVYCLSFWYYFLEIDISSYIGLFLSKTPEADIGPLTTPKYTALWLSTRSEVRNWNQKHVDIAAQTEDFYLIFVARVSATSVVGLDDIDFKNGTCPVMSGEFCDFEVNNCGWTGQGKQWQRSTQPGTYPDHTTGTSQGHYLQVATIGQPISIVKQMNTLGYDIPIRRQFCLRLFYLIDSIEQNQQVVDHASRLTIRAHNPGAFDVPQSKVVTIEDTFNEGQLRQWTMVTFNFIAFIRSNVEIEALVNSSSTKMLLDDIRFSVGFCEAEGNCNFERDMCGWYNVPRSVSTQVNSLWLRIRPSSRYIASSVLHYDHTTNTVSGNYLVMPLQAQDRSFSMIQSPLIHKTSESVCLTLYYFAQSSQSASGAFKLSLIDLTHKFRVAYLLVEATPKLEWTKYSRQFANLPKTFAFQIEAQYSTYLLSDIGLDDIVITEGDCVRNVVSSTTAEPPTEKTFDCNFDNGQCNWDYDVNNWLVANGKTVRIQYAPALDHTYQTALGKYLLYNQSSSTKIDYSIRSKSNITYNRDHCLTVWYYEDGEKPFALQINAILPDGTIRPLKVFATAIENRQRWNVLKVNVPLELASNVTSIGLEMVYSPANKQYVSIFALDDIRVLPNKCKHALDYVYTFDNGIEDLELQFIAPKGNVRGIGQRVVPFLYRPKGAPTVDHTFNTVKGSYFLFMNLNLFTTARDYIDTLSMVDLPPESRPSCVRFAYQIYGNVTLKLYLGPWNIPLDDPSYYRYLSNPWTSKYSKTSWTLYEFTKQVGYRHKMVLYMEKQLDKTSFVAIDDLTILSHACQLMINCDFEDGRYCSYTPFHDQNTSDYNFGIYRALTEQNTNWLGPRFDHTTRSYGGGYLYLTAYRTTKSFPEIISKIISGARQVDSTKSYCLSMWTRFITADVKVRLYLVRFGQNWTDDNRTIQMSTLENTIQVDWRQFSVTIDPSLLVNTGEVQLIIEGRLGANSKGIIAIDDILWSDGRCASSDALICENGTPIKSEQICNYVKDCSSGMDEFNCGNCDFEDGSTCGWLNVTHSTPWLLTSWRETSNGKAPKFDGSRNMKGHYLLVGKPAVGPTTNTEMALNHQTPSMYLKNAFKSCLMRFDYFVQITGDYAFNVRIGANLNDWATIYSISQVPTGVWRSAYVHIGERYSPFMVDFYGHFTDDTAVMAIDNVQFVNCSLPAPMAANQQCSAGQYFCQRNRFCISLDDVCDYVNDCGDNSDEPSTCASAANRCNFEYSLATCGITIEDDNAEWFKQRGGDVHGDPYKPTIDNTRRSSLGNFLELRPNNAQSGSSSGTFFSPMMTSSEGKSCRVRLFYFINGDPVTISSSFIAIYVRYANKLVPENAPIASIRVDIANAVQQRWNKAVAQFSSSSTPFQFAFSGRLFGNLSRIAVDDITYGLDCVPSAIKPLSVQSTTSAPGTSPFPSSTTPGITLNQHNRKSNSAGTVVAAVLTPLLLVAGIVLGYYGYRRYQTSKRTEDNLNVLTMKSLQKKQND